MNLRLDKDLSQIKLDVIEKTRSNIFNWRGQFTPELIEYLLDSFVCETDTIFDPFCGSGTVLLESARRKLAAIGFEINPAAYAMTRFVTFGHLSPSERKDVYESLWSRIDSLTGSYHNLPLFESFNKYRNRYKNLLNFAEDLLSQLHDKNEIVMGLNILFHTEKTGRGDITSAIKRSFYVMKQNIINLPNTYKEIRVDLCDARLAHQSLRSIVDVILTSPPYINVFNYHQNYRAIVEVLGFDILKVAESEIGSNRKNRSNRFRTVIQYTIDMEQALTSFSHVIKEGGLLILIIGRESSVRGIPFSNSQIITQVAESLGSYHKYMSHERVFKNRFGKLIKEDILVLERVGSSHFAGKARHVAQEHLEKAYSYASGEVAEDIKNALNEINTINASPLFSKKGIL